VFRACRPHRLAHHEETPGRDRGRAAAAAAGMGGARSTDVRSVRRAAADLTLQPTGASGAFTEAACELAKRRALFVRDVR
jgi:hypothetical protein